MKEGESSTAVEVSQTVLAASDNKEPSKLEEEKAKNVDGEEKSGDKDSID